MYVDNSEGYNIIITKQNKSIVTVHDLLGDKVTPPLYM